MFLFMISFIVIFVLFGVFILFCFELRFFFDFFYGIVGEFLGDVFVYFFGMENYYFVLEFFEKDLF